jgi:predicted  nucleic acid-binding Zn-ribbon protein
MNKQRRAKLNALQDRMTAAKAGVSALLAEIEEIGDDLETLRDEEQEAYDNLAESLQQGERGQDMEAAVTNIEDAMNTLESFRDGIDIEEIDTAFSYVEDAKGSAE